MTVSIPFTGKTVEQAKALLDNASKELFAFSGPVELTDQQNAWAGDTMSFSFTARYGWIAVPVAGTVAVTDAEVTVESELPGAVKQFLGEEKVKAGIVKKLSAILA